MEYVSLGKSGIEVSRVSLGCWAFGGGDYWGNRENDARSLSTIDAALEQGINFFDTAEVYGNDGHADRVLGRAMKGRRDKFVVATKVYLDRLKEKDVIASLEGSLKRLETDHIDLFYPHFASKTVPFEETFGAFLKLKEQGKIRSIGMCNFGVKAMERMEELDLMKEIDLHQVPYSLLWRTVEHGIQQKTVAAGIGMICYSTMAQGLLTGRFRCVEDVPMNLRCSRFYDAKHIGADHGESGCEKEVFAAVTELSEICAEQGIDLAPASLAWLFTRKGVDCILTGPTTPEELTENVRAMELKLPDGLAEKLTAATESVKAKLGENSDMWFSGEASRVF